MANTMVMNPIAAVRQTVQVMDQHGKVIHDTSKTFFSAFREAKEAYRLRKAEIAAERTVERRARETLRRSRTTPHTSSRALENGTAGLDVVPHRRRKPHRSRQGSSNGSVSEDELEGQALARRDSRDTLATHEGTIYSPGGAGGEIMTEQIRAMGAPMFNDPSVKAISDMLAHVQALIDELSCWTAGLSTLISELQKTPDTLAAVGLALAEISTMVAKISPIALPILKSSFPTVFALLSSPHFTIVAGIGAAATVVVLGGFKIVKSVMAGADENLKLANQDDEDYDSGLIIGEVFEDNLIEPAPPPRRHEEPVEDIIVPQRRGVARAITAPPAMEERAILGFDLGREDKKPKKKEKEEKKIKEERKREKDEKRMKEEKREKEEKRAKEERRREKEEKEERKREKEARRERKEKRAGSSVGSSSGRSDSGAEKKPKKVFKTLFDGRSA